MSDFILKAPLNIIEKIWEASSIETRHSFLKAYARRSVLIELDRTFHPMEHIRVPDGKDWKVVGNKDLFGFPETEKEYEEYKKRLYLPDMKILKLAGPKETHWSCYICMSNITSHEFSNANRFRTLGSQMFFKSYESDSWTFRRTGAYAGFRLKKDKMSEFSDNNNQLNYFFDKLHQAPSFKSLRQLMTHLQDEHAPFPYEPEQIRRERQLGMKTLLDGMNKAKGF